MSPTTKNIAGTLLALTLAFAGYYMYAQNGDISTGVDTELMTQEMLTNTRVFIERRAVLDKTQVDTEIFSDPVFRSYRTFSTPVPEEKTGRENPFNFTSPQPKGDTF
jgi:hypothetical protein